MIRLLLALLALLGLAALGALLYVVMAMSGIVGDPMVWQR